MSVLDPVPFHVVIILIDLFAALVIVGFAVGAVGKLLRGQSVDQARLVVAEGAVLALSFKVAGTLLKALELHSWDQILMFGSILGLRTILKQLFLWEKREVQATQGA